MLLIRSARVIDGVGQPPFTADVLIDGNKISAIGYFPARKADTVIDGLGYYLMPGFIDAHSDIDHSLSLLTDAHQKNFLLQGITTVVGGHCGSSLAPLLYGSLESIRKWTNVDKVNVNWHSVKEFFNVLKKKKIGINFATLVGHSTIRRSLIGNDRRDLTEKELEVFQDILENALQEGALGLSVGLGYVHGRQTPFRELKTLTAVAKRHNVPIFVHLRDEEEGLLASVKEVVHLAQETGANIVISHLRPFSGKEDAYRQALELINNQQNIYFDTYASDWSLLPVYKLLPQWAQTGDLETMFAELTDGHLKGRLLQELPLFKKDDLVIVAAADSKFLERPSPGKTIGQFAKSQGLTLNEALLKLMITTRLKALVLYKNLNFSLVKEGLFQKQSFISSNNSYLSTPAFFSFLKMALEKSLSVEKAIAKITSWPAKKFGIAGRGIIKEGLIADLVLIKDPLREPAISLVILNGEVAVKDGLCKNLMAGEVVLK